MARPPPSIPHLRITPLSLHENAGSKYRGVSLPVRKEQTQNVSRTPTADDRPEPVAALVRRFRNRRGMSQAELAAAAGVSDGMIGNVERGTRNLGVETVERVADALVLDAEERAELVQARRMFGHSSGDGEGESWDDLKSSLSEADRAAVRAIIESLKAKRG